MSTFTETELRNAIGTSQLIGQPALEELLAYSSGAGTPSANAPRIGKMYLDTTNDEFYIAIAVGTGASDWKQITA